MKAANLAEPPPHPFPPDAARSMDTLALTASPKGTTWNGKRVEMHESEECPPPKKQKTSHREESVSPEKLGQTKSRICDELLSTAASLLHKATLLRTDSSVPLLHSPSTEAAQSELQAETRQILDLHKHLDRLELEYAKVQVMLEQIRRCNANPYPAWDQSQHLESGMEKEGPLVGIDDGKAFAFPEYTNKALIPRSPYMAHYERWLIPNPHVAPRVIVEPQEMLVRTRNTRNSSMAGIEAAVPATAADKRPEQCDLELDPLIMQNSQGLWVQLRCWAEKCGGRHDFKSMQGFINHRRSLHLIAHPSHLQAADACGEPIALSEEMQQLYADKSATSKAKGLRLGPGQSAVNYDGAAARSSVPHATETVNCVKLAPSHTKTAYEVWHGQQPAYVSTVHPFNKAGAKLPRLPKYPEEEDEQVKFNDDFEMATAMTGEPTTNCSGSETAMEGVKDCPSTPYLSEHLRKKVSSTGGDLIDLAAMTRSMKDAAAGARADLAAYDDEDGGIVLMSKQPKTHAVAKASHQSLPNKSGQGNRINPSKGSWTQTGSRSLLGGIGLPGSAMPSKLSYATTSASTSPLDGLPHSGSSVLAHGPPAPLGLNSPNLPGLVSDHESIAETDDETHDPRRSWLGQQGMQFDFAEHDEDDGENDAE